MNCLNLSLPGVQQNLDELTAIVGDEDIAYALLSYNNGHALSKTSDGKESLLYKQLLKLHDTSDQATVAKARIYSPKFIKEFGDWQNLKEGDLDINGEPSILFYKDIPIYINKNQKGMHIHPGQKVNIVKTATGLESIGEVKTEQRKYTPENIISLQSNEIFVFGSNAEGIHGKGAALLAKQKFGAKQGQSEGLQGQSYAVVTKKNWRVEKSSTLQEIQYGLQKMLKFAKNTPSKVFLVTKLGSSLAGYSTEEIKSLFNNLKQSISDNVILPKEYEVRDEIDKESSETVETHQNLTDEEFINSQFKEDRTGAIKRGSVVNYTNPNKGNLAGKYFVTQINGNGTVNAVNMNVQGDKGEALTIAGLSPERFEKIGSYPIIVDERKGANVEVVVLSPEVVINVTGKVSRNRETDKKESYVQKAIQIGKSQTTTPITEPEKSNVKTIPAGTKIVANIPQNKVSGVYSFGSTVTARNEILEKFKGEGTPHSMDLIQMGVRTRTTRSATEMDKYKVKVGDVVKQYGTSMYGGTMEILTRITAIHPKGTPGFLGTWEKEGWTAKDVEAIKRYKDGAAAIEFEIVYMEKESTDSDLPTPIITDEYHPDDKVFVHAESKEELVDINDHIDKAIEDGVKTFIVMEEKLMNKFDKAIARKFVDINWIYKTKNGIAYYTKPIVSILENEDVSEEEIKPKEPIVLTPVPDIVKTEMSKYGIPSMDEPKIMSIINKVSEDLEESLATLSEVSNEAAARSIIKKSFPSYGDEFVTKVVTMFRSMYSSYTNTTSQQDISPSTSPVEKQQEKVDDNYKGESIEVSDDSDTKNIIEKFFRGAVRISTRLITQNLSENNKALIAQQIYKYYKLTKGYPSSLVLDRDIVRRIKELEKVNYVNQSKETAGIINIKGVKIDLKSLGINFSLSENQKTALDAYADWLDSPGNTPFTIKGIAGTGKTTMLRIARQYAILKEKTTVFSALTHAAAINLEKLTGAPSTTLHTVLGLHPAADPNDSKSMKFLSSKDSKRKADIIFVDEISMATDELTEKLINISSYHDTKIVLIGNLSQLPPIGSKNNSVAFDPSRVQVVTLNQVKRQNENNKAGLFYKWMSEDQDKEYRSEGFVSNSMYDSETGEGLFWTNNQQAMLRGALKAFREGKRLANAAYTKIICHRNKQVNIYNQSIREALGANTDVLLDPTVDVVDFSINTSAIRKGIPYNVESTELIQKTIVPGSNKTVPILKTTLRPGIAYKINGQDIAEKIVEIEIFAEHTDANYKEAITEYREYLDKLWKESINDDKLYKRYLEIKSQYGFLLGYEDKLSNMDYSYASTVHKAQGATYREVYIDETDMMGTTKWLVQKGSITQETSYRDYNKMFYTALTRGAQRAIVYTKSKVQETLDDNKQNALEDMSSGISTFNNIVPTTGTVESSAAKVFTSLKIPVTEHLVSTEELSNGNSIEKALVDAVPYATVVRLQSSNAINIANQKLYSNLATDPNDPRIQTVLNTQDIDLYNKYVYDKYSREVTRELLSMAEDEDMINDITFNIITPTAVHKLKTEIKDLERKATEVRLSGGTMEENQKVQAEIVKKEELIESITQTASVDDLKTMAIRDLEVVEAILKQKNISAKDFNDALHLINTWETVADFGDVSSNLMLTPAEAKDDTFKEWFTEISDKFTLAKNKLNRKGNSLITNFVGKAFNLDFTIEDLLTLKNRISAFFTKQVLSLAKVDNPIVAYIMKSINTANSRAETKAITESRILANVFEALKKSLFDLNTFWEKDRNGIITGNLVNEYSYEYTESMKKFKDGWKSLKWLNEHNEIINPTRAYSDTDNYITELTPSLGIQGATKAVNQAKENMEQYLELKDKFMMAEFGHSDEAALNASDKRTLLLWKSENSPIFRNTVLTTKANFSLLNKDTVGQLAESYLVIVPKKYDSNGAITWAYSKEYEAIQGHTEAKEFYTHAQRITTTAANNFNDRSMSSFALGHVQQILTQQFNELGVKDFSKNAAIKYFTIGSNYKEEIDPITGKTIKNLSRGVATLEELIHTEYQNLKTINGIVKPSASQATGLFKEASDNVMKSDKADLFMALNSLNLASLSYSFKQAIKPQIDMALHYLDSMHGTTKKEILQAELVRESNKPSPNQFKVQKLEKTIESTGRFSLSRDIKQEDVDSAIEMVEYFMDKEFYDLPNQDKTVRLPITFYNTEAKAKRVQIMQQLEIERNSKNPNPRNIERLKDELTRVGSQVTLGTVVKSLMDLARLKSLGWNIQSAVVNIMQGQLANFIYAAEGDMFTFSGLKQAYKILMTENTKFNNLIKNYAILGDIMYDFAHKNPFEENKSMLGKVVDYIKPFAGTKIGETANQGNVMIAMMLKMKLTDNETGGEVNMWEAINGETGALDGTYTDYNGVEQPKYTYNGETGDAAVTEAVLKIREQINAIHGDYNNPKLLQKHIIGRAIGMYKFWFFDPYHARFGTRRYNYILKKETEGRYISTAKMLFEYGLNYKKFMLDYRKGVVDEVEFKNLRTTLAELTIGAITFSVYALTRAALCEGSKCENGAANYVVNLLNRLDSETRTFTSAKAYYDFFSKPAAVMSYLDLLDKISRYTGDMISGKGIEDSKGENKMLKMMMKEMPLLRQARNIEDLADVVRTY